MAAFSIYTVEVSSEIFGSNNVNKFTIKKEKKKTVKVKEISMYTIRIY